MTAIALGKAAALAGQLWSRKLRRLQFSALGRISRSIVSETCFYQREITTMDPVTVNILESTMVSICREMGIVLMRTAYSTIFSEALDFTCGLANMEGDLMAVADYCPSQIGGMPLLVKSCLREIPVSEIEEGDIILHNDP